MSNNAINTDVQKRRFALLLRAGWRGAEEPVFIPSTEEVLPGSATKSLFLGLFTQLSNPKTAVVYGGIFAALLPHNLPPSAALALPFLVFLVEAGWYSIVVLALSSASTQATYLRSKMHIDRVAGGVMGLLGLKLIAAARYNSALYLK